MRMKRLKLQNKELYEVVFLVEIEIVILGLVLLVAIYFAFSLIMKSVKFLAVNSLVGLIILYLANLLAGLGIPYTVPVVLVCAILGAPGAIAIIILRFFGVV